MFSCGTMASEKPDQAAVSAVVNVDMTGLAGMNHARDGLAVLTLYIDQYRRTGTASRSHTSWAMYWKWQAYLPVSRSRETSESV